MTTLPSGLVTFVFTDIEGSTRLSQRLGESYATLLAAHDRLVRDAITAHGGVVMTSMGDGVFVVFGHVASAVEATADLQRALTRQVWPSGVELLVRVGLHCAQAQPRDGSYVELAVHQAARVASAAYGGQVLATSEVVEAAPAAAGGSWADLGAYRLKDFDEPVRLFELLIEGGAGRRLDGTRATPAAAHNVPEALTPLVGRTAELPELTGVLATRARLVTVLGPGGVGKTRLAFEAVRTIARSYAQGAWVVLLANATTAAEVESSVLRTLRIPDRANRTPRETLLQALEQRETLLLLDNTEQVTEEVAGLVRELLQHCPRLTVLVTSRQPLGLAGEVEWRLPPLPYAAEEGETPEAVELFIQRATARNPRRTFDADDHEVIMGICREVDGLPLAIELAAGRLRHMTLRDLAGRLHERLRIAAVSDRDVEERQRTLHAVVDWSYRLLTPAAQKLLRQMSVLQGPAPLEAVEALADTPEDVAQPLAELVDKSLVSFDEDAAWPYRMLVTIRDFAQRELCASEEALATRHRHARYHIGLARQIRRGLEEDSDRWLAVADRAYGDLAAAMAFAEADGDGDTLGEIASVVARCLYRRGRLTDGRTWGERAARLPSAPSVRVRLLYEHGYLLATTGDTNTARRLSQEGLELALLTGDPELISLAREVLATAQYLSGDLVAARDQVNKALTLPLKPWRRAIFVGVRGIVAHLEGRYPEAIDDYRAAYAGLLAGGNALEVPPWVLADLGEALVQSGRLDEAEEVLNETLRVASGRDDTVVRHTYLYLGKLHQARDELDQAAHWAMKALALARENGDDWLLRECQASGLVDLPPNARNAS